MTEYVYALHDFLPEHEDEVSFHAGERIEVIEKDDEFGDGWWQGRNLAGKAGLFPVSYTTPAAPPSVIPSTKEAAEAPGTPPVITLQPLDQEVETPAPDTLILSTSESTRSAKSSTSTSKPQSDGEVMKATMTDVEQAIEQLGRDNGDGDDKDGGRSFSFASTRDGDLSDDNDQEDGGEDWHKGARRKLADAVALRAMAAEDEEKNMEMRSIEPPIEVELSDESDDEEEDHERHPGTLGQYSRDHPRISEEDEEEDSPKASGTLSHSAPEDNVEVTIHTVTTTDPLDDGPSNRFEPPPTSAQSDSAALWSLPTPVSPGKLLDMIGSFDRPNPPKAEEQKPAVRSPPMITTQTIYQGQNQIHSLPSPQTSKRSSVAEGHNGDNITDELNGKKAEISAQPSEWTVGDVVTWLKGKGFDDDVCNKFIEQEITGDVLLELDVNLLKTEIGILAFGKRARIANAITDLRRPPSIAYSDSAQQSPLKSTSSHNQPSTTAYSYTHSHQSSLNSPASGLSPLANSAFRGPESPMVPGSGSSASDDGHNTGIGLGFTMVPNGRAEKSRPSQLTLSPSDSNLKGVIDITREEDDKAVMSDGEAASNTNRRRRLFGRSPDSGAKDKSARNSREISSPLSSSSPHTAKRDSFEKDNHSTNTVGSRHSRKKRSLDGGREKGVGERLSLFGSTFPAIGKSRKPPPKYSSPGGVGDVPSPVEKEKTPMSLSRFYGGSSRGSGKAHGDVDPKTPKSPESLKEKDGKESTLLRKRTGSDHGDKDAPVRAMTSSFKPGQSVLEQIGEPNHSGYMRKKGDRYNTWKLRYFILKGSHMYCLRSDSKSETKIKGYINIVGYKVIADENLDPGRYGFRIIHDTDQTHYFSSDEQTVIRDWMKAIMKSTIGRDYTRPVMSSCNVPTIPLMVAQTMSPSPRPPSPTARAATQKAMRRENPNQLSRRDAEILMGPPGGTPSPSGNFSHLKESERATLNSFLSSTSGSVADPDAKANDPATPTGSKIPAPPRPTREQRTNSSKADTVASIDDTLIEWANSHLPAPLRITDPTRALCGGLALLRLAESIKGYPSSPPVPDSAFPSGPKDEKLDGLFRLFDFLLDNDVKMGSVSINDVRQGKQDKILHLLRALKSWDDHKKAVAQTFNQPPNALAVPWELQSPYGM